MSEFPGFSFAAVRRWQTLTEWLVMTTRCVALGTISGQFPPPRTIWIDLDFVPCDLWKTLVMSVGPVKPSNRPMHIFFSFEPAER